MVSTTAFLGDFHRGSEEKAWHFPTLLEVKALLEVGLVREKDLFAFGEVNACLCVQAETTDKTAVTGCDGSFLVASAQSRASIGSVDVVMGRRGTG